MNRTIAVTAAGLTMLAGEAFGQLQGPSSSSAAYVVPVDETVTTAGLLTVGDGVPGEGGGEYRLVGIPDGTGAFDNGDGTFTWLVNHELNSDAGVERAHGAVGAFVSKWIVDAATLEILSGEDLIKTTNAYDPGTGGFVAGPIAISRLCSADLPALSAFYDADSGLGTQTRIFTNGEETGAEGRAFAHIVDGDDAGSTYELAWMGNCSWENVVASPASGVKTVVIGFDDATPGEVYVYVGEKTGSGSDIDKAGLTNGTLYGIAVEGLTDEDVDTGLGGPESLPFIMSPFGDVSTWDGAMLQTESDAQGVTKFLRPEDGHWDPTDPNSVYWCTTGANGAPGRLWRLEFNDITGPESGGTIHLVLDGTEGMVDPDNLVVDHDGNVLIQEDPGGNPLLARIWYYQAATDELSVLAEHSAEFFMEGEPGFLTTNEESSGIIDAIDVLGEGWYLFDVQAHYGVDDPELVQGGQLQAMYVPAAVACVPDYDKDGELTINDFVAYQQGWQAGEVEADVNYDGAYDVLDFVAFQVLFQAGCN